MAEPILLPAPAPDSQTAVVHDDVRHFLWDRTLEDNPLELDLEFSDTEIGHARRFAAMMFNSIPPLVRNITAAQIPNGWEYGFMLGTVYHLLLAKLMVLQRKQIDYSAGNITIDLTKNRVDFLSKWVPLFKEEAMQNIKQLKLVANLESGYACY